MSSRSVAAPVVELLLELFPHFTLDLSLVHERGPASIGAASGASQLEISTDRMGNHLTIAAGRDRS